MPFSTPIDRYELIQLDRADHTRWQELPPGYSFMREIDRDAERELLQSEFPQWEVPFNRQLPGLRDRGVICVACEGKAVGIAYACEENELGIEGYAQIHYVAVRPEHRGRKLLSAMVTEMLRRFEHIPGAIFYSDRDGHREMYERWGGHVIGQKEKPRTTLHQRLRYKVRATRGKLAGRGRGRVTAS